MAHIRTLKGVNDIGFDPDRNLLIVPLGKTASVYLVDSSLLGTDLKTDDESIAAVAEADLTKRQSRSRGFTPEERAHPLSRITVKGLRVGTTMLRTDSYIGSDEIDPVEIRVVPDPDSRQSGDRGALSPEFRAELQELSVRQAVLRVAEDQMYSSIGRKPGGFGRYADKSYDWCGAFAWYCWNVACTVHGVTNPFGNRYNSLLSCQKAISWALQTDSCTILRYGSDPFGNSFTTGQSLGRAAERQEYIEIGPDNPLLPADIVIIRTGTPSDWKHVCLAMDTPNGDDLPTIDGNQTIGGTPAIAKRTRSMKATCNNGKDYSLIFLHVLDFDE